MTEPKNTKTESIKVGMRLRPFVAHETGQKKCLMIKGNTVSVLGDVKESKKEYLVDVAMDSTDPTSTQHCSQEKCYKLMAQPLVESIMKGYNVCLFAYGQTGTGKTTTIMGKVDSPVEQGILIRMLRDIFDKSDDMNRRLGSESQLTVEMIEIYNEKIKDLLVTKSQGNQAPDIRVHPRIGAYLTGVTEEAVNSLEACVRLVEFGNTMKTVAATAMNSKSSRSHTIFRLKMEKRGGSDNAVVVSEVFFVDLAGRENEKTTKVSGDRLVELSFINRSLMWLSQCIQTLGNVRRSSSDTQPESVARTVNSSRGRSNTVHTEEAPRRTSADNMQASKSQGTGMKAMNAGNMAKFRNSKLTLLLMNALSGNSKTAMIGTLSPAAANFDESMSTLNFASTVKNIKLAATPASEIDKDSLVKTLQDEVEELKSQLAVAKRGELPRLSVKLDSTKYLLDQFQRKWEDQVQEGEQHQSERENLLKHVNSGKSTKVPYIANYNEDPFLAGRFVFHPAEAARDYSIGYASTCDFVLPQGVGVQPVVCYIRRQHGEVHLRAARLPNGDIAQLEVNGHRLGSKELEVQHHDCIIFGSSLIYYLFTKNDGGLQQLPVEKQSFAHSATPTHQPIESFIPAIIGEDRSPDQQVNAKHYLESMQSIHRDAEGTRALREFLIKSERAGRMIREANDITTSLRKTTGISFELISTTPILGTGFGAQGMPEMAVRVVRPIEAEVARRRETTQRARRQSIHADLAVLKSFEGGVDSGKLDVLYVWTFAKFQERLQIMQDLYEAWTQDPANFVLDPLHDPWRDYGLGEVSQLKDTYEEKAGELTDRMVRRKSMDLKRRLSPVAARVGSTLATSPSGIGGPASPVRKPIGKPKQELLQVLGSLKETLEHFL